MPQYQGIWTLPQQSQALTNQQWVTDPYYKNTTLHLQADGTGSGSQNQTFLDSSSNNFFITRNGNATQGSFSPFCKPDGQWSNYFDGSGDYISMPSATSVLALGSGDWAVECFAYVTSLADNRTLIDIYDGNSSVRFIWRIKTSGLLAFQGADGTDRSVTTTAVPTNTWVHLAICKSSGTTRMFINGVQANTNYTDSNTYANGGASAIGIISSDLSSSPFLGYISNFRVVKGTALYSANFNPPTLSLSAITNTSLLTCQSNRFVDNSSSPLTLTIGGTPSVQAFSPFAPARQWTPDVVGGSMYNAAAGDGVSFLTSSTQFGVSGDFTIETWIYPLATSSNYNNIFQVCSSTSSDTTSYSLYYNSSYTLFWLNNGAGGNGFDTGTGITFTPYQWNHIVISRASGTIRCWVNGVMRVSGWGTGAIDGTQRFLYVSVSRSLTETVPGYTSGFRFVNGTAVYSGAGNFTPPTSPPTNITNTAALVNCANAGIYDATMNNNLETAGDIQVVNLPSKTGSGSMKFDGTGDYLSIPNTQLFNFGSGNFTIEFWAWINTTASELCVFHNQNADPNGVLVSVNGGAAGKWRFFAGAGGSWFVQLDSSVVVTTGKWNHIACTRNNNVWTLWLNGVNTARTTSTSNPTMDTNPAIIGRFTTSTANAFNGYLDDFRITTGVARYTSDFTPPQQALPRQ